MSSFANGCQLVSYTLVDTAAQAQTLESQLMLIDGLRSHLGHASIFLLGHGYGGFLAQEYALRYSQSLTGLILCATMPALDYRNETSNRLSSLTTPTLVIAGRRDWYTPPVQAERLHSALPDSRLVIFDRSDHFPFVTETTKFITVVSQWISEHTKNENGASL